MYLPAAKYWLAVGLIERDELDAAEAALELPGEEWAGTSMYALWRAGCGRLAMARGNWRDALREHEAAAKLTFESFGIANPAVLPWRSDTALCLVGMTWVQYATVGILVGIAPGLLYLRTFKPLLDADVAAVKRRGGTPDPAARAALMRAIAIGGALCEIPMAMGVVQLFFGGETRWFLGATLLTIALRLSYRPFTRS